MKQLISFIRRKILRIPADRWDYQYSRGEWDNLASEKARFEAVIQLIRKYYTAPSILEIGCGKALMQQQLKPADYSRFVGVDLSEVAIQYASRYNSERVQFVAADMQEYNPSEKFDVVCFNESLYYAKDPAVVFARYLPDLKPGGSVIVTAFSNKYTANLWPSLDAQWQPEEIHQVQVGELVWDIHLYKPGA